MSRKPVTNQNSCQCIITKRSVHCPLSQRYLGLPPGLFFLSRQLRPQCGPKINITPTPSSEAVYFTEAMAMSLKIFFIEIQHPTSGPKILFAQCSTDVYYELHWCLRTILQSHLGSPILPLWEEIATSVMQRQPPGKPSFCKWQLPAVEQHLYLFNDH